MPIAELVALQDAQAALSLSGKGGAIMRQYMDYISQLETGRAGKLTPDVGETTASVRCGLAAAAQPLGKNLSVKRQGNVVFFREGTALPRLAAAAGAAPRPRGAKAQERFGLPTSVTPNKTSALTDFLGNPGAAPAPRGGVLTG